MLHIEKNVKDKRYRQLIDLLLRNCDIFAFVENGQYDAYVEQKFSHITEGISDYLIEKKQQREWETTRLTDDIAFVSYYRLNHVTKQFLVDYCDSLFGWLDPELPEDLMFYQENRCILAVCSHEQFFKVNKELWAQFRNNR